MRITYKYIYLTVILTILIILSSCNSQKLDNNPINSTQQAATESNESEETSSFITPTPEITEELDYSVVKPNEAGKIMVVMFHNFVDQYKSGDKYYTTTFKAFRELLGTLYAKGYRLIGLNDYMENKIDIKAGYKPIIFTFDDGTKGQFNLVEGNGELLANRQSAVGIMEEFYESHPDFGLEGTFFVNLGDNTFTGEGTVAERLKYLIDKGFEIGNHTFTHINLKNTKDAETVLKEIGGNQKRMYELVPGYKFTAFSLPFGLPSKELQHFVVKGVYDGVEYENKGIMEVGWDPALSPVNPKYNPLSIHRVRASGMIPVDADLAWWLGKVKEDSLYISDGNPNTVTVPAGKESSVDKGKLGGKKLIVY